MNLFYYVILIAMTILWEAPHQPRMGQELVAHTIINRAELSGMNIEAVVMAPRQYAGWTAERRMRWLHCALMDDLPWCMDPMGHLGLIRTDQGWREATARDWSVVDCELLQFKEANSNIIWIITIRIGTILTSSIKRDDHATISELIGKL